MFKFSIKTILIMGAMCFLQQVRAVESSTNEQCKKKNSTNERCKKKNSTNEWREKKNSTNEWREIILKKCNLEDPKKIQNDFTPVSGFIHPRPLGYRSSDPFLGNEDEKEILDTSTNIRDVEHPKDVLRFLTKSCRNLEKVEIKDQKRREIYDFAIEKVANYFEVYCTKHIEELEKLLEKSFDMKSKSDDKYKVFLSDVDEMLFLVTNKEFLMLVYKKDWNECIEAAIRLCKALMDLEKNRNIWGQTSTTNTEKSANLFIKRFQEIQDWGQNQFVKRRKEQ